MLLPPCHVPSSAQRLMRVNGQWRADLIVVCVCVCAGLCQCLEPMAVFYVATHSMLAHHPKPTPDTLRMRCAAAILATIAATAVARDNPAKRDASLHFARRCALSLVHSVRLSRSLG